MTTPSLREAARAICRVQYNGGDPDQPAVRWNGTEMEPQEFPAWEDFLDEARAVIAALAQPDEAEELSCALARIERLELALVAADLAVKSWERQHRHLHDDTWYLTMEIAENNSDEYRRLAAEARK